MNRLHVIPDSDLIGRFLEVMLSLVPEHQGLLTVVQLSFR